LICWQKDDVLARIYIKARVTDLTDVPHYLIFSEGDDHEGVSLTVQCEIVQQDLLGAQLQDEDIPPGGFDNNEFIYPGMGGPPFQHLNGGFDQQGQQNVNFPALPDLNDFPGQHGHIADLQFIDPPVDEVIPQQEAAAEVQQ
jgi:hypothetical protein